MMVATALRIKVVKPLAQRASRFEKLLWDLLWGRLLLEQPGPIGNKTDSLQVHR